VGPSSLGEEIMGAETSAWIWHVIEEKDSMSNGKWPVLWIGDVRPMYGCMEHDGACN
jgi:hypothetical protein